MAEKPTAASIVERAAAVFLGVLALIMFAAGFPALVESQGASLLLTWPGAVLLAYASRSVWRGL